MPFIPNTESDRAAMLKVIGAKSVEELFSDIPAGKRYPKLGLPSGLSELEILREIESMAARNLSTSSRR
jgi:glycine dehydrogenase subunit 1